MFFILFFIIILIFIQGDEEKRQGIQPQALMDRSLAHELPKNQVNFFFLKRKSSIRIQLLEL
jgi:hypothetical protein